MVHDGDKTSVIGNGARNLHRDTGLTFHIQMTSAVDQTSWGLICERPRPTNTLGLIIICDKKYNK